MAVNKNRTADQLNYPNAYTNNTFSLQKTKSYIEDTMESSFRYMKSVQNAYVELKRFHFTQNDVYINSINRACVSCKKDFIDVTRRKTYRSSDYFGKWLTLNDIVSNSSIFTYIPIMLIDDCVYFDWSLVCALDGHTDFNLNLNKPYDFIKDEHTIDLLFFKNSDFTEVITNKYQMEISNYKVTNGTIYNWDQSRVVFVFAKLDKKENNSNFFFGKLDEDGNLQLDRSNTKLMEFFEVGKRTTLWILSPKNAHLIEEQKEIHTRNDNGKKSAICTIQKSEWEHYPMPIPEDNLMVFKINQETDEIIYDNLRKVSIHYPNIYEIDSEDLDSNLYKYLVCYLYEDTKQKPYKNIFYFIYRYFSRSLGLDYESTIKSLLYGNVADTKMVEYFYQVFNYEDYYYKYDHSDFFNTMKPYDFDYKISKMKEFIKYNPWILKEYGKDVQYPYYTYFLFTEDIDLTSRIRNDTKQEFTELRYIFTFDTPHYLFKFRNDEKTNLNLRFFIDGKLCTDVFQIHYGNLDYIYIPASFITDHSYVEIESLPTYIWSKTHTFNESNTVTFEFDEKDDCYPTIYDLYIVDKYNNPINRSKFKFYMLLEGAEYDISDGTGKIIFDGLNLLLGSDNYIIDEDTGDVYIELMDEDIYTEDPELDIVTLGDSTTEIEGSGDGRLPVKYTFLKKIKVVCPTEYLNMELTFLINKQPILYTMKATKKSIPTFKTNLKFFSWRFDSSFVRTFLNGKRVGTRVSIGKDKNGYTIISPNLIADEGDVVAIDITPYSYELEFTQDYIGPNYIVSFDGKLSKPFDLKYYDAYLNGRKLSDHNIQVLTPDKVKLFNVESAKNFEIYRRDRDYEYYGFKHYVHTYDDDILESEYISDEDKEKFIEDIIRSNPDRDPDEVIEKGTDTEPDIKDNEPSGQISDYNDFYINVIVPEGVCKPNTFGIPHSLLTGTYPTIWNTYGNEEKLPHRLVLRPNIHYDAGYIFALGCKDTEVFPENNTSLNFTNMQNNVNRMFSLRLNSVANNNSVIIEPIAGFKSVSNIIREHSEDIVNIDSILENYPVILDTYKE